jgi:hypothetical protein
MGGEPCNGAPATNNLRRRRAPAFVEGEAVAPAEVFTVAQLANALALASPLTLLATELALVFGLRDVMNFAHGALFMFGAYLAYTVSGLVGFWAALVIVPIALGLVGVVFEYAAFRPLRERSQMDVALMRFTISRLPTWRFHQVFGMTETGGFATMLRWRDHQLSGPKAGRMRSSGQPAPGNEVRILLPDGSYAPPNTLGNRRAQRFVDVGLPE